LHYHFYTVTLVKLLGNRIALIYNNGMWNIHIVNNIKIPDQT